MADEIAVDIEKGFRSGPVIRARFRLSLETASTVILFGPSGSGKTTLLRCIAGLESPDRGQIRYANEIWFDGALAVSRSVQARRIGFLHQDYALFPHLTVRENIEYGLRGCSRSRRLQISEEVMCRFEIADIAERRPREISGGQAQRVALARVVAPQPRILLLDEPLAALDLPARIRLRAELRRLLESIRIPTMLVTHDRTEAIALGQQIVIMAEGEVRQTGPVDEVFRRPADAAVASTVGVETILRGVVAETGRGLTTVQVNQARIFAVPKEECRPGDPVLVCIRAEEVTLQREIRAVESARNHFEGTILMIESEGLVERVSLDCGFPLVATITRNAREEMDLRIGSQLTAAVKATAVHLIRS